MCAESLSKDPHSLNHLLQWRGRDIHMHLLDPVHNCTLSLQAWAQYDFGCELSGLEGQRREEMNS